MKTETIKQNVLIGAEPKEVYDAFTTPKIHSKFTKSKAEGGNKVGGKFTSWDGYIYGKVIELVPYKKIVYEWSTTEWPEGYPPSIVELIFSAEGSGTNIAMIHKKVPSSQAKDYEQGWTDFYWNPLKAYFKKIK